MEVRARYVSIGVFTLAVIALGMAFVYWLYNTGGFNARVHYDVRFKGSIAGLYTGSSVTFNGVKVGEVTDLSLDPRQPQWVLARIAVSPRTPVRADTRVQLDFEGITGSAAIALGGGSADAQALVGSGNEPPLLIAGDGATESMSESARTVLRKLDGVLSENAEPLKSMVANLNTFSGALARNSDRVDGILSGLDKMTGGSRKSSLPVVDLTALAKAPAGLQVPKGLIVIPEPTALAALDNDKLSLTGAGGPGAVTPDVAGAAQWSDALPKLVQTRLVQSFENAGLAGNVSRPADGLIGDYQLQLDLRSFRVIPGSAPTAEVEISAKVQSDKGKIAAGRVFRESVAVASADPGAAAEALNEAFAKVSTDLVSWTASTIASLPPPMTEPAPSADAPQQP